MYSHSLLIFLDALFWFPSTLKKENIIVLKINILQFLMLYNSLHAKLNQAHIFIIIQMFCVSFEFHVKVLWANKWFEKYCWASGQPYNSHLALDYCHQINQCPCSNTNKYYIQLDPILEAFSLLLGTAKLKFHRPCWSTVQCCLFVPSFLSVMFWGLFYHLFNTGVWKI